MQKAPWQWLPKLVRPNQCNVIEKGVTLILNKGQKLCSLWSRGFTHVCLRHWSHVAQRTRTLQQRSFIQYSEENILLCNTTLLKLPKSSTGCSSQPLSFQLWMFCASFSTSREKLRSSLWNYLPVHTALTTRIIFLPSVVLKQEAHKS